MKLSIVIPCRNAAKTIAVQLEAVCSQQWRGGWEVIVADNGSTDGTQQIVERYYGRLPALRLIDASARRGAAHARNAAARVATGDALLFVDADDEVGAGWLAAMGEALSRYDFVASRMDVDKLNPPLLARTLNNVQGRELRRAYYPPFLLHAGSSGMGVKRKLHERVGGFDETLSEREDTDYCFRIQRAGVPLRFAGNATIHIRYSENPKDLFHQARRWARCQVLLYKRHGDGVPLNRPWLSYLRITRGLLRSMPKVLQAESRARWMKAAGTHVGLLEGAIRYRVPPVCHVKASEAVSAWQALGDALTQQRMALLEPANPGLSSFSEQAQQATFSEQAHQATQKKNGADGCATAARKVLAILMSYGIPVNVMPIG